MRIERHLRAQIHRHAWQEPGFEDAVCERVDLERAAGSLSQELKDVLELLRADLDRDERCELLKLSRGGVIGREERLTREIQKKLGLP